MKATASATTTGVMTWLWRAWLIGACLWVLYGFFEISTQNAPSRQAQEQRLFTADSCGSMGDRLTVSTCVGLQRMATIRAGSDAEPQQGAQGGRKLAFLFGPPLAVLGVFYGFLRLFRWGFS